MIWIFIKIKSNAYSERQGMWWRGWLQGRGGHVRTGHGLGLHVWLTNSPFFWLGFIHLSRQLISWWPILWMNHALPSLVIQSRLGAAVALLENREVDGAAVCPCPTMILTQISSALLPLFIQTMARDRNSYVQWCRPWRLHEVKTIEYAARRWYSPASTCFPVHRTRKMKMQRAQRLDSLRRSIISLTATSLCHSEELRSQ